MDTQLIEPDTSLTSRMVYWLAAVCAVVLAGFVVALFVVGGRADNAQGVTTAYTPGPTVTVTRTVKAKAKPAHVRYSPVPVHPCAGDIENPTYENLDGTCPGYPESTPPPACPTDAPAYQWPRPCLLDGHVHYENGA